jgi:hypothetical protein
MSSTSIPAIVNNSANSWGDWATLTNSRNQLIEIRIVNSCLPLVLNYCKPWVVNDLGLTAGK